MATETRANAAPKQDDLQRRFDAALRLASQKHTAEALEQFRKLSDEYPAVPEIQNNLAVLYVERGELDKAQIALEAALKGRSSYETIYRNLSNLNARRAAKAYAQALSLDTSKSAPVAGLSMITAMDEARDPMAMMARVGTASPVVTASLPTAASSPASAAPAPAPTAQVKPAPVAAPTQVAVAAARPTAASPPGPATAASAARTGTGTVTGTGVTPTPQVASAPATVNVAVAAAPKPASAVATAASAAASAAAVAKVASASAPASAPVTTAGATTTTAKANDKVAEEANVRKAVQAWANAWEAKDMTAYLAAYAPGFKGAEASPAAWQAARRVRIVGKKSIDVKVSGISVTIDATHASATFTQAYTADQLKLVGRKTLNFELRGGRWLITRESAATSRA